MAKTKNTARRACRVTGPDGDGFFWLERCDTSGAFGAVNLGCCDEEELLNAFANFLGEKDFGDAAVDHPGDSD